MKKLRTIAATLLVLITAFTVTFGFTGCFDGQRSNKIRVCETARSIFYAPLYVAVNNGYFEEEGLDVEVTTVQGSDLVMTTVISGGAEIGLMGPETTVYCRVNGQKDYPVIFAQLTKRDGSFLVAKQPDDNFTWEKLRGKHVLAGRAGGVPAMTMQYIVNKAGMDYTTMFEPTASEYVAAGKGYIVASVGEASGEVPYTAFSASKSYVEENADYIEAFIRAIIKGYDFIIASDAAEVAKSLQPHFMGIDLDMIEASVISYREIDAWAESPVMKKEAFETLKAIMKNAGFLSQDVAFEDIVDNSYAIKVTEEL